MLQFDQERGYGFIGADDGGEDVFLHASVFDGDSYELAPGVRIEFKVMEGVRGRKALAAHPIPDIPESAGNLVTPPRPAPPAPPDPATRPVPVPAQARAVPFPAPQPAPSERVPDDEPMCDVLAPTEFDQELTELLLANGPTLTGKQILEVRQSVLECARKHGWVDI